MNESDTRQYAAELLEIFPGHNNLYCMSIALHYLLYFFIVLALFFVFSLLYVSLFVFVYRACLGL